MTKLHRHHVLALAAAALVAACGGGTDSPTAMAQQAAAAMRAAPMRAAPMRAGLSPDAAAEALFTAAEGAAEYHQYFPSHQSTQTFAPFKFRYYPETGVYLGVAMTAGMGYNQYHVYVAGGGFGTLANPYDAGPLSQYGITVDTGGGGGTASSCYDLTLAETQGTHIVVAYQYSGTITGTQTVDTLVGGMTTFQGYQARETTVTTTGSNFAQGFQLDGTFTGKNYSTRNGNALTQYGLTFNGSGTAAGYGNVTMNFTNVFNPPFVDESYGLSVGQTFNGTQNSTVTGSVTVLGFTQPVNQTGSTSYSVTYVGNESVSVPAGTFDACKLQTVTGTGGSATTVTSWVVVGKGIPVKTTTVSGSTTQTIQATSATINGTPL